MHVIDEVTGGGKKIKLHAGKACEGVPIEILDDDADLCGRKLGVVGCWHVHQP